MLTKHWWPCGVMDKVSDYASGVPGSSPGKVVIFCLILRYTLYLIFTAIIVSLKVVALWPNG